MYQYLINHKTEVIRIRRQKVTKLRKGPLSMKTKEDTIFKDFKCIKYSINNGTLSITNTKQNVKKSKVRF